MYSRTARVPGVRLRASRARTTPSVARSVASAVAPALAAISLLGLTLCSVIVVAVAAERPSFLTPTSRPGFFPGWMAGPISGLWPGLTSNYHALVWISSALIATMYVLYVIAFATVPRLAAHWTVAALLAIHVAFLLAPPLSYTDVFNYVNYGRMGVVHHLNPYTTIPLLEPHSDESYALSNWHRLLSPYGPLFTLFSYALVPLGVAASFWALKLVLAVASLATLALVWRCAVLLGRSPAAAVVFVGCNPIVLVWGLGADHNDTLMLFFAVFAAYLLVRTPHSSRGAGAALVAAVFIKASAAVLLPIFLLVSRRRRFLRGGVEAAVGLGLASLIAFGTHLPNLATQSGLVTAVGIPNLTGLALGAGGETATLRAVLAILLVVAVACWAACVARGGDWLAASALTLLALIVSLSWAAPWYLAWALPFAALARNAVARRTALVLGAYLILAFMPAAGLLAEAIDFRPDATALGIEHRREVEALVRP